MKLIFIHGRSQSVKNAEELRLFWEGCLGRSFEAARLAWPAGTEVILPFYADDLDRMVREVDAPLATNILLRGEPTVTGRDALRVEMLREMLDARHIPDDRVLAYFEGRPVERGPQNWPWVLAMLRALDSTEMGGNAIDTITRDVWVYLTFGGVRAKIDAIVGAGIPNERCVVVAHSLGSLVAYNILSSRTAGSPAMPLFLTLGSPLGMHAIASRLRKPLAFPRGAAAWLNARDPRDVVALFPLDRDHFDVEPAVEDYSQVENFTDNHHSIDGYLADALVARRIHEALSA
ncbi:MAG: alpha/beta hydrolase [Acidobacteriia bacterium]|nr:alpha/beta hydrolase [Terriglobia bacterium]